jgi:hypothetical protein
MLVSVDAIQEMLGLPTPLSPETEELIERSAVQAQILVSAYVGFPVEQDMGQQRTVPYYQMYNTKLLRLDEYPARVTSVKIDGVEVPADQYTADARLGMVNFKGFRPYIEMLEVKYAPGFTAEKVPKDLLAALENITIAVYENGGRVPTTSGTTNELKSMTMFDAMSMSFETGGANAAAAGTPEGMLSQWAFVLDRYKIDSKYVMR